MTHVIIMNDGNIVETKGEVNIQALATLANKNSNIAVKVGRKVMQKHLISAIAPTDAVNRVAQNIAVQVANQNIYTTIPDEEIDAAFAKVETDLNNNAFVVFNDILINRAAYQVIEDLPTNE